MQQQRRRRFRAALTPGSSVFDSNSISPGTEFMKRIDKAIIGYIEAQKTKLPSTVVYSPHTEVGEGEHKIMDIYP